MSTVDRRKFIKGSLAVAAAGATLLQGCNQLKAIAPVSTKSKPIGANKDVRLAIVGLGKRGPQHIKEYRDMPGVRIVAVCDPDETRLAKWVENFEKDGVKVAGFRDVRKLLERDDIDAVSDATPNYWHSLLAIWACQAGKDVYTEKPVSHTIWEGRQAVEASRRYNRIVQCGINSRSSSSKAEALRRLHAGELGKILVSRGFCYKPRKSIGKVSGTQIIPKEVDYNLWAGPTALAPLMRESFHYDWHWVWPTGNGDIGNQGPHQMDIARRANGAPTVAARVMSIGGRFGYDDDGTTANTQIAYFDFGKKYAPLIFEVRGLPEKTGAEEMPLYRDLVDVGNVVDCEGGFWSGSAFYDDKGKKIKDIEGDKGENNFENFITAVRSQKRSDQNADILEGHISTALCHQANISYRLGEKLPPEEIKTRLRNEPLIAEAFERMQAHLVANGVDIAKDHATLGPWLEMNPKKETFTGPSEWVEVANAMLRRTDREPFVVPEIR